MLKSFVRSNTLQICSYLYLSINLDARFYFSHYFIKLTVFLIKWHFGLSVQSQQVCDWTIVEKNGLHTGYFIVRLWNVPETQITNNCVWGWISSQKNSFCTVLTFIEELTEYTVRPTLIVQIINYTKMQTFRLKPWRFHVCENFSTSKHISISDLCHPIFSLLWWSTPFTARLRVIGAPYLEKWKRVCLACRSV